MENTNINYNDLIAEWLDSIEENGYERNEDGTFFYIDIANWSTHLDFDKFVKEKLQCQKKN